MKAKQIEKLLTGVMNSLIDSINDDEIIHLLKNASYITGGCIPSMLMDEYVNDYDIYFTDHKYADEVKKYYEKRKPTPERLKMNRVFEPKLITENAINLTDKIQLILKFAGSQKLVTSFFDWEHITSYFSLRDGLVLTDNVYRLIVEKDLIYTGSNYPLSSLLRLRKFIKKGWTVSTKTMVHIVMDILAAFQTTNYGGYNVKELNTEEGPSLIIDKNPEIDESESFDFRENKYEVSTDTLIHQLNGVDPLTIQVELEKHTGKKLSLKEILELL